MPYIGNAPYQGLVDSGNIVDGGVQTIDLANSSVTTAKVADGNITTAKLAGASVTAAKLASDVTDLITVGGSPKITSVVVTNSSYTVLDDTAVDVAGGYIKITGTGFSNGCQVLINNTAATSVTFISATEVRAQVPATSAGTYVLYVVNSDGGVGIRVNGITFSSMPAWSTGSTLSSAGSDEAISIQLSASSNSAITYTLQAGSTLPAGLSLSSGGLLSGTIVGLQNETTYNFTVLATDVENQDTSRAFSITITVGLPDDYYKSVVLHLPGNGTNLATNNQFLDGSTNNFTITRNGNTTQGTFSPFSQTGWSNYFDGNGDGLSVPANAVFDFGSGNFTVEAWVYLAGNSPLDGSNRRIANVFSVSAPSGFNFNFLIFGDGTTTGTGFEIYNGSNAVNVTGTINQKTWNHVAVSKSGTSVYFWLNGTQMGSTQTTSGNWGSSANGAQVGRTAITGYSFDLNGYLSNVRVLKGTALYTSAFTPPITPLTAITNTSLLTCQSNRFIDNSTNNFTITRNGDTSVVAFSPFNPSASWSAATYGGSGYFDGNSDYLALATGIPVPSTGTFTIEAWVYLTDTTDETVWTQYSAGTAGRSSLRISSGKLTFANPSASTITTTASVLTNAWAHVAAVRDSSNNLMLFINGNLDVTSASYTASIQQIAATIGAFSDATSALSGYISNLRITSTAVYTGNFTPPSLAPLTNAGSTSAASYPSTTNVNTSFASSATSLLLNFTNAGIYDATSKNVLETVGDAKISTAQSKWAGSSIAFDGTGDYLLTNSITGLQALGTGNFTIEMWAYWNSLPGSNNMLIDYRPTTTNGAYPCLYLNGTALYYYVSAANQISATNAVATGAWYHIALCRAQNNTKLFVNGLQVGSTYADTNNYLAGTGRPYIGINGYDATGSMNGYIDDLRITRDVARYWYNFTPPAKQFKVSYGATPIPATDEYFDYTTLLLAGNGGNTLQNNSFVDSSTNNFTITRSGNTTQGTFSPFSVGAGYWSNYFNNTTGLSIPTGSGTPTFWNSDFTIEYWVNCSSSKSINTVFSSWFDGSFGGGSWWLPIIDGAVQLFHNQSSSSNQGPFITSGSTLVNDNIWHHIAITQVTGGNKTFRIFIDGVLCGYTTQTNWTQASANATIYVGAPGPGTYDETGRYMLGSLSNIRLTTSVVAAYSTSATTLGTTVFTPPTSPLTAISGTYFLICQSNRFVDNSASPFTLTVNGTPYVQAFSPFAPAAAYSAVTNGGSGYFDGTGDYLKTTGTVGIANNAFTICCWFYPLNSSVIGLFDSGPAVGGVFRNYPANTIQYQAGGTSVSIQDDYQVNAWNWMNITKSGSSFTVYINGVNAGSGTCASTMVENQFTVGTINNGADGSYLGYISDFQILNTSTIVSVPTAPIANASGKTYLLNFTNAAIIDNTAKNDLETVGNAQISTTQSKFGGASLYFDGTGDYLSAADSPNFYFGSGDWTIEAWLYINTAKNYNGYFGKRQASQFGLTLQIDSSGTLSISASTTGSSWALAGASLGSGYSTGAWMHVAVTRSGTTITGWRNGTSTGTQTLSGSIFPATGYIATIGSANDSSQEFNGYIDDFRITKGIARYVQNFTPPSAALQLL